MIPAYHWVTDRAGDVMSLTCKNHSRPNPVYTIEPVVQPVWQPAVSCKQTSSRLSNRLTTGWMFVYTIQPVVKPVVERVWQPVWQPAVYTIQPFCQTGCQMGLTTGWMFVYTIQPVVKPVWQQVVSCKRGLTNTDRFSQFLVDRLNSKFLTEQ